MGVSGLREVDSLPHALLFQVEGRAWPRQAGLSHAEGEGGLATLSGLGWWRGETEPSLLDWAAAQEGLFLFFHLPPCSSAHCCWQYGGLLPEGLPPITQTPAPHPHPGPNITMT